MPARHNPFWVEDSLLRHLPAEQTIDLPEERVLVRRATQPVIS